MRKPKLLAFVKALVTPIVYLYDRFISFKDVSIYKLTHNSQVCYMEAVLNDSFDNASRRIVIRNARILEPNWLYHPEDNKPKFFYDEEDDKPRFLYDPDAFEGDGVDFTVIVPVDIRPSVLQDLIAFETKMKGLIDYYKLYSKNYIIRYE